MKIEVQGHRGARGLFPENTLEGFRATVALGVDAIELDVGLTADGELVVFHDVALSGDLVRGPDGAWLTGEGPLIHELTLAELKRYDVGRLCPGSLYAAAHPAQVPHDGARIPTLAETFAATAPVRLAIELKTLPTRPEATATPAEMAAKVVAEARRCGALQRIDVRSFDWRGLHYLRQHHPEVPLTFLTTRATVARSALWWDGMELAEYGGSVPAAVARHGAGVGWAPASVGLTEAEVREAHSLGLRVYPWTVNAPAEMAKLLAWQVDGLCSDRPDLVREVLAGAGLAVPTPGGDGPGARR
jgi:glycerophosphoryl diester phosphodiesterase